MRLTRVMRLKYRPTRDERLLIRLDTGLAINRERLPFDERQLELRDIDFTHMAEFVMEDGTESVRVPLYEPEAKALDGLDVACWKIDESRLLEAEVVE
jgi:hypothetical protein